MIIEEHINTALKKLKPIKEHQDVIIPGIDTPNIPKRNGFICALSGAPGTGKSSLLYSMLKSPAFYKGKFNHIDLFVPEASYLSIKDHPLRGLKTIHHDLTASDLDEYYKSKAALRKENMAEDYPTEYSLLIIDDFGDRLRDEAVVVALKRILVKSRHICTACFICIQGYMHLDARIRGLLTNCILFKPTSAREWSVFQKEMLANLTKDEGVALQRYIYDEPFSHLDIDTKEPERTGSFICKNFNRLSLEYEDDESSDSESDCDSETK